MFDERQSSETLRGAVVVQKVKTMEDRAEKCAVEAHRRVSQLTARLPKPFTKGLTPS